MKIFLLLFLFISNVVMAQDAPAIRALGKANEGIEVFDKVEFDEWIIDFKKRANRKYKISEAVLEEVFRDVKYNPKIILSDRKQPEFMKTFWSYYDSALNPGRIADGKIKLKQHSKILNQVSKKYNVQPQILVAFWGLETNYGKIFGDYNVISALTTLSFDIRRSEFFTEELIQALKILDAGHMKNSALVGSWAGAFGNFQFLPSTFMKYAVDGDGDGKIDIVKSIPDAMHSAGNYLSKMGWDGKIKWGRPVLVDKDNIEVWEYVNSGEWGKLGLFSKLGVKNYEGGLLPVADLEAQLIAPNGVNGPVFMVYKNYKYIMSWNASQNYALSVGLLSDAIVSNSIPVFNREEGWDKVVAMSTNQIKEMQEALKKLDIYDARVSGIYGKKTMQALKKYQKMLIAGDRDVSKDKKPILNYKSGAKIITDGYPSSDLYEILVSGKK